MKDSDKISYDGSYTICPPGCSLRTKSGVNNYSPVYSVWNTNSSGKNNKNYQPICTPNFYTPWKDGQQPTAGTTHDFSPITFTQTPLCGYTHSYTVLQKENGKLKNVWYKQTPIVLPLNAYNVAVSKIAWSDQSKYYLKSNSLADAQLLPYSEVTHAQFGDRTYQMQLVPKFNDKYYPP